MAIRRNVDLGPMYLPVGEEAGRDTLALLPSRADAAAVHRFNAIFHRDGRARQGGHAQDDDLNPEDLFGIMEEPDSPPLADTDDIGSEIAHLWVGTGLRSGREVRVGLRESLLPDTSVRLHEQADRLQVEFTCCTSRVASWLDLKLEALARELGERLDRHIELSIVMGDGRAVSHRTWSGGPS